MQEMRTKISIFVLDPKVLFSTNKKAEQQKIKELIGKKYYIK